MHHHLSWFEAAVVGLFQGVAELFPVSSLGHSVLIPALIGGSWARDLNVSSAQSPYLAFIVGLHVATALALVAYFWRDWVRIIRGLLTSIRDRKIESSEQHLAWLLIAGTVPVGIVGLVFEHTFRVRFGKPLPAGIFLFCNGLVLLLAERLRRRAAAGPETPGEAGEQDRAIASDHRLGHVGWLSASLIGATQIGALFAGISRSGVTMVGGLARGLSHEDAARFAFLLATRVILAAGVLKLPDLAGHQGDGIRGQVLLGSLLSGIGAYVAVRYLDRYFQTRTLVPFGIYCLLLGGICAIRFGAF